jgi:hypothetical protein
LTKNGKCIQDFQVSEHRETTALKGGRLGFDCVPRWMVVLLGVGGSFSFMAGNHLKANFPSIAIEAPLYALQIGLKTMSPQVEPPPLSNPKNRGRYEQDDAEDPAG